MTSPIRRIIIVDDHDAIRRGVRQLLDTMAGTAVDLVLRMIAGEWIPAEPHRVPTVFVPRGPCGCTDATLTLRPAVEPAGRPRLAERLDDLLPPIGVRSAADLDVVREAVATVAAAIAAAVRDEPSGHDAAAAALHALHALQPQPDGLGLVSRAIQEYTRELPAADAIAPCSTWSIL